MAAVIAALRDGGVAQKDIATTQFSVQPVYTTQSNTEPKLTGFSASNQVAVTIRQMDKVGDITDRMVAAGATNIGNLVFLHSDASKLLDQAREAAVADARRKSELYARASGVGLGKVLWINETSAYTPYAPLEVGVDVSREGSRNAGCQRRRHPARSHHGRLRHCASVTWRFSELALQ
jgi:uncharacterized protein YggE